jgi:hypothetical protein
MVLAEYKRALLEVHRLASCPPSDDFVQMLASARSASQENTRLLDAAVLELEKVGVPLSPDVHRAVQSLRLKQWVYLRDTTKHSIFIDSEEREAFAVVGLTDRIRDLLGRSAVAFRTGIVEFRGRFVCDGIIQNPVLLGANYKREFNAMLADLKKESRLHIACDPFGRQK